MQQVGRFVPLTDWIRGRARGSRQDRPPRLRYGSRGRAVVQLQQALRQAGFDPGPTDGVYGLLTESAVRELEAEAGLASDGQAGPAVWAVLSDPYWRRTHPWADPALAGPRLTYRLALPPLAGRPEAALGATARVLAEAAPHLTGAACHILDDAGPTESAGAGREWDGWGQAAALAGLERWGLIRLTPSALLSEKEPAETQSGRVADLVLSWSRAQRAQAAAGILWDLQPWRLPGQWSQLRPLLEASHCGTDKAHGEQSFSLAAWLPLPTRGTPPFAAAWERVIRSLRGAGVDFLWLSAWRRPEDWRHTPSPLQLAELDRWIDRTLEVWPPWRMGLVLPTGGWQLQPLPAVQQEGLPVVAVPLTRRECLRLGPRPGSRRQRGVTLPGWERDLSSGLLARADHQVYLVDPQSWREWLQRVKQKRLGGVAVCSLGQQPPTAWLLLAEDSGRILPANQESPDGTGISM